MILTQYVLDTRPGDLVTVLEVSRSHPLIKTYSEATHVLRTTQREIILPDGRRFSKYSGKPFGNRTSNLSLHRILDPGAFAIFREEHLTQMHRARERITLLDTLHALVPQASNPQLKKAIEALSAA